VRRIFQTRADSETGNCFEACVASLLDCELDAIPAYTENNERMQPYLGRLDGWLRGRGLAVITIKVDEKTGNDGVSPDRLPDFIGEDTPWIASVDLDDAGHHHAVVMRGSRLWHDPQRDSGARLRHNLADRIVAATVIVPRFGEDSEAGLPRDRA
jgi:hypothetical protein